MKKAASLSFFILVAPPPATPSWAGEIDTVMTLTAEFPGSARQLLEASGSGLFAVVGGVGGGLASVTDEGYEPVYQGEVVSAAASLDGYLFFTIRMGGEARVMRLSAEEASREGGGDGDKGELPRPTEVTDRFGSPASGDCRVVRSSTGEIWVEGAPALRRADGAYAPVPTAAGGLGAVPLARDVHGNSWSLSSSGDQVLVRASDAPAEWRDAGPSRGGPWSCLVTDVSGFVWVGGADGLRRHDPLEADAGWLELPAPLSLPTGPVTSLGRSPDGKALACFSSGEVVEIDYARETRKAEIAHLTDGVLPAPADVVYSDSEGRVWLGIGSRLYRKKAHPLAWQRHWEVLSPLPGSNHDIFSVEVDGRLYTAGGVTVGWGYPARHHWFDELWEYDSATQVWGVAGKLQEDLCYNGIAALGGDVWVVGGAVNVDETRVSTATVQIYDPRTGAWRLGPPLNEARQEPVAVTAGNRVYAIGGASDYSTPMTSVESIGSGESQWRMEPALPEPMRQFAGAVLDGVIYCISKDDAFSYDAQAGSWSELPRLWDMPQAAQVAAHDGEIWVLGGVGTKRTFRYDPKEGSWRPGPPLPTEQSWGSASDLNGRLIVAGGAHWSELHGRYLFDDAVYAYREGSFVPEDTE